MERSKYWAYINWMTPIYNDRHIDVAIGIYPCVYIGLTIWWFHVSIGIDFKEIVKGWKK